MKKIKEYSSPVYRLANAIEFNTFYISITNGKIHVEGKYSPEEDNTGNERLDTINPELLEILNKKLKQDDIVSNGSGLADYVKKEYQSDIESILFDRVYVCGRNGEIATTFRIEFNWTDPIHSVEEIIDYTGRFLIGQCSDGWGERFEQIPFYEDNGNYWDMWGDMFFSPWSPDSRWIPEIKRTLEEDNNEYIESTVKAFRKKLEERSKLKKDIKNLLNK